MNAAVVRGEIIALNDQYGPDDAFQEMPCPYTSSLMVQAWYHPLTEEQWTNSPTQLHVFDDVDMGCWDAGSEFSRLY